MGSQHDQVGRRLILLIGLQGFGAGGLATWETSANSSSCGSCTPTHKLYISSHMQAPPPHPSMCRGGTAGSSLGRHGRHRQGGHGQRLLQRPQCLKALKAVAEKLASTSPGGGGEGGPDAVALAIAMAQPFHPMVLSGAASVAHLRWVQEKGGT